MSVLSCKNTPFEWRWVIGKLLSCVLDLPLSSFTVFTLFFSAIIRHKGQLSAKIKILLCDDHFFSQVLTLQTFLTFYFKFKVTVG